MVTILWVDDEIYNIQALPKMLAKREINVIKARTKSEAFEKLSSTFDLILLDIILPQDTKDILKDTKEPYDDLVGLSILRWLISEKYPNPIFVFTIVNDFDVRSEIKNYGIPYFYKGSTKLIDLCNEIIKVTNKKLQ